MKDAPAQAGGMSFNHHITLHFWEQVNRKKALKQLLYPASPRHSLPPQLSLTSPLGDKDFQPWPVWP